MSKYRLPVIQELRAVKSSREVAYIVKAQRISEVVLGRVVKRLRVDVTEIALARFIVAEFKRHSIKALAFEPIVSFGKNTANIHHEPGRAKLRRGNTVMFDFGCTVNSYCSDMTRTYFFGQPTAKQKRVYSAVLQAQQKVLDKLNQGERQAKVLDATVRKFLTRKFGQRCFEHGLGHGVGTAIHEWPSLKVKSPDVLKPNMVVTLEPGVYLKGWGGVRIEDMVVIRENGIKNLTKVSKDLKYVTIKNY